MPYQRMKLYVGIFITFLFLALIATFGIVLQKKGFFQDKVTFYFLTNEASSFYVGMPLNVSGVEVGTISQLILMDDGHVKVYFKVPEINHKWICEDTLLMLDKPLIGSPKIQIMTSLGYPELRPDTKLEIIIRDDINDIIVNLQPLMDELQQIVHSIHEITYNLASKDGSLEKSLANLEKFTRKFAADEPILTTITGDPKATKALTRSFYNANEMLENLTKLTKELNSMLMQIEKGLIVPAADSMEHVNRIFKDIENKLAKLDGTVNALGSYDTELLLLKKELHINLDKTQQLLEKVDMLLNSENSDKSELP